MSTLFLEFWTEDNDFCIYAATDKDEKELTLTGQAPAIVDHFNRIYTIIQELRTQDGAVLQSAIDALSKKIIVPFASLIQRCDLVRIIVYEDLVRCAFDLLTFNGAPLFLQRRVCYQVDEGEGEDNPTIEANYALLIADRTADPEEACRQVAELMAEAEYFPMQDASMSVIRKAADDVDLLVISAHGDVEADNYGALYLNEESLQPSLVAKLEAWVVYFDSCQQGINMAYLDVLQEESDIQYYLGPIISNDAGDSSTKTMLWFFTEVLNHKNPILALFTTRRRLFDFYHNQQKLDLITTLNKAFAFRLYEMVG